MEVINAHTIERWVLKILFPLMSQLSLIINSLFPTTAHFCSPLSIPINPSLKFPFSFFKIEKWTYLLRQKRSAPLHFKLLIYSSSLEELQKRLQRLALNFPDPSLWLGGKMVRVVISFLLCKLSNEEEYSMVCFLPRYITHTLPLQVVVLLE